MQNDRHKGNEIGQLMTQTKRWVGASIQIPSSTRVFESTGQIFGKQFAVLKNSIAVAC
jgi:hypothetical protein